MNKVFTILKEIFLVTSFIVFGVAMILSAVVALRGGSASILIELIALSAYAFIGLCLMHTKNDISYKIGLGMAISTMVSGVSYAIATGLANTQNILVLVSAIIFVLYFLVKLIGMLAVKDENMLGVDAKIEELLKWHDLKEKGIINDAEYEQKRNELLKIKKDSKQTTASKANDIK